MIKNGEIELWDSADVAREIGVSRRYVNRLMKTGRIPAFLWKGVWMTVKSLVRK